MFTIVLNTLLNNAWVEEELTKKARKYFELIDNKENSYFGLYREYNDLMYYNYPQHLQRSEQLIMILDNQSFNYQGSS